MTTTTRSATSTTVTGIWGDWFGSYATASAAKRYLTMEWTGPKVPDRGNWDGSAIRITPEGRWQVRLAEKKETT